MVDELPGCDLKKHSKIHFDCLPALLTWFGCSNAASSCLGDDN